MKVKAIIFLLLISSIACSSADYAAAFHIEYESDEMPSTLSTENAVSKEQVATVPVRFTATPSPLWHICTGVENGTLRVRNAPGVSAKVIFTLREGREIHLSSKAPTTQKTGDGATWIKITDSEGWVNARYICETK